MVKINLLDRKCELALSGLDVSTLSDADMVVWRNVFNYRDPRNFAPSYVLDFSFFEEHAQANAITCKGFGLSLFDTEENLIKNYERIKQYRRTINKIGNRAAFATLGDSDGGKTKPNTRGHITYYPYRNIDLDSKFKVTKEL